MSCRWVCQTHTKRLLPAARISCVWEALCSANDTTLKKRNKSPLPYTKRLKSEDYIMAFLKNMYQKLLGEEIDEESDAETADASDEGVNEEAASNMADEKKGKAPAHSLELKIAKLSAFDGNVMEIADHLIAGGPVVLNLDAASKEAVKRIIDFFSGVAYSVKGQLKNISGNIYIVTPASVDVSNDSKILAGAAKAEEVPRTNSGSPYAGF